MEGRQFIRFVLTGGFAALVNLTSRYFLNMAMTFAVAVVLAYLCGMVTAYVLGRLFVFENSGRSVADEFWRFTLVNVFAAAQVWVISVGLGEYLFPALSLTWHPLEIAHLIGVSVPVVTSYVGHRHFSFAKVQTSSTASAPGGLDPVGAQSGPRPGSDNQRHGQHADGREPGES